MDNQPTSKTVRPAPVKKKGCGCAGCACFTTLGLLILAPFIAAGTVLLFPAPILRWTLPHVETQTDATLMFEHAYFDFAEWFLTIDGLSARRQNHHTDNFDLKAEKVRMPVSFLFEPSGQTLFVVGLRGTYERVSSKPAEKKEPGKQKKETALENFYVKVLYLRDVQVEFIDRTPVKPFQATIQIREFAASPIQYVEINRHSLFEPYTCITRGQINSAEFDVGITQESGKQYVWLPNVPLGLFAPYVPVLDDIFVTGSVTIRIDDISDETHKKIHVTFWLRHDCEIKPANEILAPALQTALQKLDHSSVPALHELKGKIERLKTNSTSLRTELDKVAQIMETLKVLAPRDVQEKYDNFKSRYDQITKAHEEWDSKFETLLRDLDQTKVGIVHDTFRHFVESRSPIEVELQQVDGEWQYDAYDVVLSLIENNYRTLIDTQYQRRIQEIRDAVDRLLTL